MSINHSSVILIGVEYDDLIFDNLTDFAKELVREESRESSCWCYEYDEESGEIVNQDEVEGIWESEALSYFNAYKGEFLADWFNQNIELIGNCFTGIFDYIGIGVELSVDKNYDEEIDLFLKYVNVAPTLHHGVYVW